MVPFADTVEYFDKYAPLIRLLRADDDYEWLLETGYKQRIVGHFWKANRSALADYANELEADFQALYDSTLQAAIGDEQLALELVKFAPRFEEASSANSIPLNHRTYFAAMRNSGPKN